MDGQKTKRNKIIFYTASAFLCAGILLAVMARKIPGMAEWYARHIYPALVSVMGRLFGLVPFSAAEIGLYLALICLFVGVIRLLFRTVRRRDGFLKLPLYNRYILFLSAAVLFFLYEANCGVNYYRVSFAESAGIVTDAYTAGDLKQVCVMLSEDLARYCGQVERDGKGGFRLREDMESQAVQAMYDLSETYPQLRGYFPKAKKAAFSGILSVQGLTGVYSPFTAEANYNRDMPDSNIPFTICHELSHLRGFMREDEANFIAYLACMKSPYPDFRYSGSLMGWIYCMDALYQADPDAYRELWDGIPEAVKTDLRENSKFWGKYDGKAAEVSGRVNDTYLKANGQEDGIRSYGRMADLMTAYYLAREK